MVVTYVVVICVIVCIVFKCAVICAVVNLLRRVYTMQRRCKQRGD